MIKLGFEGHLTGFDINTAHFVGNHAPLADVEACYSPHKDPIYGDDTNVKFFFFIIIKIHV